MPEHAMASNQGIASQGEAVKLEPAVDFLHGTVSQDLIPRWAGLCRGHALVGLYPLQGPTGAGILWEPRVKR